MGEDPLTPLPPYQGESPCQGSWGGNYQVPLNPSDKRGKTREKIPSYLLPLSGELGDLGGWLCIGRV